MSTPLPSYASCSGCSLCLLACPVWRQTKDIRLTPHGRAKALQHGATAAALGESVRSCTFCGACEPACPENIPLVDMMLVLRQRQPLGSDIAFYEGKEPVARALLLPGRALRSDLGRLVRVAGLLDVEIAADDGSDIALALESGAAVPSERLSGFLSNVGKAATLIVAEGLLLHRLRQWLPRAAVKSLGEALSTLDAIRVKLRPGDLYVIEPRAYHADHARLVGHYDRLRAGTGIKTNLDLQRLAIPTTASSAQRRLGLPGIDPAEQARWILEGRDYERVVVEDACDCAVFAAVTDRPVVHVADL